MASNKKVGNDFESRLCNILSEHGFWVHNMAQTQSGQPADVIAVRFQMAYLIDCKVCSTDKGFDLRRVEYNQESSMSLWRACGNGEGWFAILVDDEIYMVDFHAIERIWQWKYTMSGYDIRTIGIPLERWCAECK